MAMTRLELPIRRTAHRAASESPAADALLDQLRTQLGPFGYQWLCACAVYPKLRFSLSTYLGAVLAAELDRPPPNEDEHLALFRLPWFRQGSLPEELRVRLVGALDPRAAAGVRAAIERALYSVEVQDTDPTATGPVALSEPPRRWRAMLRAYWDGASPDAAENDRIFIRYMNRRAVTPEAIARQRWLESLLGRDLAALLRGGKALILVGAIGCIAAAATADSWLKARFDSVVQVAAPPQDGGTTQNMVTAADVADAAVNAQQPISDGPIADGNALSAMTVGYERLRRQIAASRAREQATAARLRVLSDQNSTMLADLRLQRERLAIQVRAAEEALALALAARGVVNGDAAGGSVPQQSPVQRPLATRGVSYSRQTIREVEQRLGRDRRNPGPQDGVMDAQTVMAIRAYERSLGLPETGTITPALLSRLGIRGTPNAD